MLLISVVQISFVYFGGDALRATPLKIHDLVCVICISFSVVLFDFARKLVLKYLKIKPRQKPHKIPTKIKQ